METGTDAAKDIAGEWVKKKEAVTALKNMDAHDIQTLIIPTDDEEIVISINILRVLDGWIYWSDDTNLNVFVPDRGPMGSGR